MMNLPIHRHEDNRRMLFEWIGDYPITTCKAIIMKEDGVLGNHYHNIKRDFFFLLKGEGHYKIGDTVGQLKEYDCLTAPPTVPHTFSLKAGSILLEASTTPYNKEDELQIFN